MPKGSKLFTLSLLLDPFHLNYNKSSSMKKASVFLKEVFTILVSMVKAKTMAVKSKTRAMKARLIIFGLLRDKKILMSAISHKIHALKGPPKKDKEEAANSTTNSAIGCDEEEENAIVLHGATTPLESEQQTREFEEECEEEDGDVDRYPDLRHSLFDEEEEELDGMGGCSGSVIDMVRTSKEQQGEEFKLEDEIDHVADIFIRRFHKKMRMEKLSSFKRYKEMLERSA